MNTFTSDLSSVGLRTGQPNVLPLRLLSSSLGNIKSTTSRSTMYRILIFKNSGFSGIEWRRRNFFSFFTFHDGPKSLSWKKGRLIRSGKTKKNGRPSTTWLYGAFLGRVGCLIFFARIAFIAWHIDIYALACAAFALSLFCWLQKQKPGAQDSPLGVDEDGEDTLYCALCALFCVYYITR